MVQNVLWQAKITSIKSIIQICIPVRKHPRRVNRHVEWLREKYGKRQMIREEEYEEWEIGVTCEDYAWIQIENKKIKWFTPCMSLLI